MSPLEIEIVAFIAGAFLLYWPYVWCWYRKESLDSYGLVWNFNKKDTVQTIILSVVLLALLTPISIIWPGSNAPHMRSFEFVLKMGASGLAAAVIEETFFRGWLQTLFRRRFSAIPSIIMVNMIFAPIHLIAHPNPMSLLTFFPGLVMGALREKYNNIFPAMIFHLLGNLWAIWFYPSAF
ncbi:CPBP family intramembrane metalloprotease [Synergistaceae bacterium OttesenSCG-928-D05]|nr:CPBP family intramembrane metalloprotease [Synergistaceae bacterium OttesenSCG-928-D05]